MLGSSINSLRAQRRLTSATNDVSRSFERLSSGSRINRASDDAAGLAIADSLRSKARIYGTALRNTNDGMSMLNIVDSTLDQQISIVQRLQELAEQSANGALSGTQRRSLDGEYKALLDEFGRTAETATFNGRSLLSGAASGDSLYLQIGLDGRVNSRIGLDLTSTNKLSGSLAISQLMKRDSFMDFTDLDDFAAFLNGTSTGDPSIIYSMITKASNGDEIAMGITGFSDDGTTVDVEFSVAYKAKGSQSWVVDTVGGDYGHTLRFDKASGQLIDAQGEASNLGTVGASVGTITTDSGRSVYVDFRGLAVSATDTASAIGFTNILTVDDTRVAIDALANRLSELNAIRGKFGALGSRLSVAANLLSVGGEVTKSAEGRIRDTDVAAESSRLIVSQLKQQAAASVLAQANQDGRLVLDLLRG